MTWQLLYSLLWNIGTPWVKQYLKKRARKAPAYLEHWDERFGTALSPHATGPIWVHAVSVGETRAALPLINALQHRYPHIPLLITQMTPTGRAIATELYGKYAEIRYLPYDYSRAVKLFIETYQPRIGVLMETELWPNLIRACAQAGVPLLLANARLSEKSFKGYHRIRGLICPVIKCLAATAAQSEADARRLKQLGADSIIVCGNIKYDINPPAKMLNWGKELRRGVEQRKVLVCASTRLGEEELIFNAWAKINTTCLLVVVPRHPERFTDVYQLAIQKGFTVQRRSDTQAISPTTQIWLGDSMGELFAYYQMADIVFIGGSLQPFGSHSLIEPAVVGRPILFGPSIYNFTEASKLVLAAGAGIQIATADELVGEVVQLIHDDTHRQRMGQAALKFAVSQKGATARIVKLIDTHLRTTILT